MNTLARFLALARDLEVERAKAQALIEKLRLQLDELTTAPLPKSDFLERLNGHVDSQIQVFDANVRAAIERLMNRPNVDFQAVNFPFLTPMNGAPGLDEKLIVALLADATKQRIARVVDAMQWPSPGPRAADRPKLRQKIMGELAAAEAALAALNPAARTGLLQHPDVQAQPPNNTADASAQSDVSAIDNFNLFEDLNDGR
jgi:hypothetical protein